MDASAATAPRKRGVQEYTKYTKAPEAPKNRVTHEAREDKDKEEEDDEEDVNKTVSMLKAQLASATARAEAAEARIDTLRQLMSMEDGPEVVLAPRRPAKLVLAKLVLPANGGEPGGGPTTPDYPPSDYPPPGQKRVYGEFEPRSPDYVWDSPK
jgi:hypothetical protein